MIYETHFLTFCVCFCEERSKWSEAQTNTINTKIEELTNERAYNFNVWQLTLRPRQSGNKYKYTYNLGNKYNQYQIEEWTNEHAYNFGVWQLTLCPRQSGNKYKHNTNTN